ASHCWPNRSKRSKRSGLCSVDDPVSYSILLLQYIDVFVIRINFYLLFLNDIVAKSIQKFQLCSKSSHFGQQSIDLCLLSLEVPIDRTQLLDRLGKLRHGAAVL